MRIQLILIQLTAIVFLLFGIAFVFAPEMLAQLSTGSSPDTPSGLIDMRATYGGMSVAVGLLLFCLAKEETAKQGLTGVILLMLGMATGRAYGMLVDGDANDIMVSYLVLKLVAAGIAIWALRLQHESKEPLA